MNYMECGKCIYYTGGFCKEKGIIRDEREVVTDCKDFELKRFRLDKFEVDNDGWRQYFIFDDEKIHEHKFGRVVTIVNELLKENEELKKENEELKERIQQI